MSGARCPYVARKGREKAVRNMARRSERTVRVYEVLFQGPEDGPAGPAGDGTFVRRFDSKRDAEAFAAGETIWGRPAKVDVTDAPARVANRWGFF